MRELIEQGRVGLIHKLQLCMNIIEVLMQEMEKEDTPTQKFITGHLYEYIHLQRCGHKWTLHIFLRGYRCMAPYPGQV